MIKIYRKIRYDLMEKNKFGKYLLYAIGEIILVVVGIIIALQVNNWNEDRKKQDLKNEYLISLKNDYSKDTKQLNEGISLNKKRLAVLNQSFDEIENTSFSSKKELISIFKNKFAGIRVINTYNTNSFNILISSGHIDLLDKQLRESIMELNRLQVHENEVSTGNRDFFFRFMSNYSFKYPSEYPNKSLNEILWEGVETKELPKDLMTYFDQEAYTIKRYLELSEDVLIQTKLVFSLLDDRLNK